MPNPRLFLSHAEEEAAAARELATRLRAAGLDVWLDLEQPPLVADPRAAETALSEADAFAVYVGRSGIHNWVDREVRVALERSTADPNFRIFPILGSGANRKRLPAFLAQYPAIDLTAGRLEPETLQRLVSEILESPPRRISLLAPEETPFRGLLPFGTEHAHLFFGRDREIEELVELLEEARFLAVVGTSGSGKSSLVLAGLAPALRRGRSAPGAGRGRGWRIASFRPGRDPFEALCKALPDLIPQLEPAARETTEELIAARLAEGTEGLSQIAAELAPRGSRALLIVDQFEEVFGDGIEAGVRRRFIDSLLRAAAEAGGRPIHVLITLRADFFDHCLDHPRLPAAIAAHQYPVRRMGRPQLRAAIEKPAAMAGLTLEPGLADAILGDLGEEPGSLPLLEHALHELWEQRRGDALTHDAYRRIGRLQGALEFRAEEAYRRLGPEERPAARRIFTRLVRVEEDLQATRHAVPRSSVVPLRERGATTDSVLNRLIAERLVTVGLAVEGDEERVEIAHEGLVRGWGRLRAWLEEDRDFLSWRRRLQRSMADWKRSGGDPGDLLGGGRLEEARHWSRERPAELDPEQLAFIRDSVEAEEKIVRRKRLGLAALIAVAAVAVVFAVYARQQHGRAEQHLVDAGGAVHEMTRVARDELVHLPLSDSVRQDLLDWARRFYEKFELQGRRFGVESALVRRSRAEIYSQSRDSKLRAEVGPEFEAAIAQLRKLAPGEESDPEARHALGATLSSYAEHLHGVGRLADAERYFDEAVELQRRLAEDSPLPEWPEITRQLAITLHNRGLMLHERKENDRAARIELLERAKRDYEEAIELRKNLIKLPGDHRAFREELAATYNNLANLLEQKGDLKESRLYKERALETLKKLYGDRPQRPKQSLEMAQMYNNLANNLWQASMDTVKVDPDRAAALLRMAGEKSQKAVALFEHMARPEPVVDGELANAYISRGLILELQGHDREAAGSYRRAREVYERLEAEQGEAFGRLQQERLGNALFLLGRQRLRAGEDEAARELLVRAIGLHRRASDQEPGELGVCGEYWRQPALAARAARLLARDPGETDPLLCAEGIRAHVARAAEGKAALAE